MGLMLSSKNIAKAKWGQEIKQSIFGDNGAGF